MCFKISNHRENLTLKIAIACPTCKGNELQHFWISKVDLNAASAFVTHLRCLLCFLLWRLDSPSSPPIAPDMLRSSLSAERSQCQICAVMFSAELMCYYSSGVAFLFPSWSI